MIARHWDDAAILLGLAAIAYGAWLVAIPLGLIVSGMSLLGLAFLLGDKG